MTKGMHYKVPLDIRMQSKESLREKKLIIRTEEMYWFPTSFIQVICLAPVL